MKTSKIGFNALLGTLPLEYLCQMPGGSLGRHPGRPAAGFSSRLAPYAILPPMRLFPLLLCLTLSAFAQEEPPAAGGEVPPGSGGRGGGSDDPINAFTFASLRARNIGPAFVSGRVSQIAVFPDDSNHYLI